MCQKVCFYCCLLLCIDSEEANFGLTCNSLKSLSSISPWDSDTSSFGHAMQNYNQTRHDFEIHLENASQVDVCPEEAAEIPQIQYHVSLDLNAPFALSNKTCFGHTAAMPMLACLAVKHHAYLSELMTQPHLHEYGAT